MVAVVPQLVLSVDYLVDNMTKEELAKQKAFEVAQYMEDTEGVPHVKAFAIMIILAIAGFLIQLLSFIHQKNHDAQEDEKKNLERTMDMIKNPTLLQKITLRRLYNEQMGAHPELRYQVMNALVHVANKTTEDEVKTMIGIPNGE